MSSTATSCYGNMRRHPSKRADIVSVPISSDIDTLIPRLKSHIFNHSIFIAI